MPISYLEPLRRAWGRMKVILFRPFDLWKWVVIGFTAWMAGILEGPSGSGPRAQWNAGGHPHADPRAILEALRQACTQAWDSIRSLFERWPAAVLVLLLIPIVLAILLALLWLSSRFKLIYLDNVIQNCAAVAEPWRRLGRLGDSLFAWRLGFGLAAIATGLVLSALFVWLAVVTDGAPWTASVLVVVFAALFFLAFFVALAYTWLFLESFVVPIMYRLNLPAMAAWREFLPLFSAEPLRFVLYGLFVLGLFLLVGLGVLIVGLATCCIGFLVLALPYVGVVLLLPLYVTYRLLGPEFIAQFDSRFDLGPAR